MKRIATTAALALALVSGTVFGLAGRSASPATQEPLKATLEDLGWLSGSWTGVMLEQRVEEVWSAEQSGAMMGMFRLPNEKKSIYEFMLLEEDTTGIHLRFHHFSPGMKIWEKEGPLEFKLVAAQPRLFTFESPDPAQSPTRILYGWSDEHQLFATVQTVRDGKVKESFDVIYSRVE